ncbi:MAG TPA: hypothetical protein DCG75_03605 [Bacteroidales bacterium]|nr:hypothetical protein [Bacteroidales bacterium]
MGFFKKVKKAGFKLKTWGKKNKILKKVANVMTGGAVMMSKKLTKGTFKLVKGGLKKIQERKRMSKYDENISSVEQSLTGYDPSIPENMDGAIYDETSQNAESLANDSGTAEKTDFIKKYGLYAAAALGGLLLIMNMKKS